MKTLDPKAPSRSATDVGPGDYVKIGSQWKEITSNSATGAQHTPKNWSIRTADGGTYDMWGVNRYAKAEDLKDR